MHIQIIGYGNMAKAIVGSLDRFLQEKNSQDITLHIHDRKDISQEIAHRTYAQQGVYPDADCIILAVKPQSLDAVDVSVFSENTTLISILAGITIERLSQKKQFGTIVRAMPSLLMQVGASNTGWFQQGGSDEADFIKEVLRYSGSVTSYPREEQLNDHTALFATGPAIIPMMMQMVSQAATTLDTGLSEKELQQEIHMMVTGTMQYLQQEEIDVDTFIKQVMSKGGTTQAFREKFQELGGQSLFDDALQASKQRARELS